MALLTSSPSISWTFFILQNWNLHPLNSNCSSPSPKSGGFNSCVFFISKLLSLCVQHNLSENIAYLGCARRGAFSLRLSQSYKVGLWEASGVTGMEIKRAALETHKIQGKSLACRACQLPFSTQKQPTGCSNLALNPRGPSFIFPGLGSGPSSLELKESQPIPTAALGCPIIQGLAIIRIRWYNSFLDPWFSALGIKKM